jgi:predicted transcriptional regulator
MPAKPTNKQTKIPASLSKSLKVAAAMEERTIKELCEEALHDFIQARKQHLHTGTRHDLYLAQLGADEARKVLNVELGVKTAEEVDKIADKDNTTTSTVLYTSLIRYAKRRKMLQ